MKASFEEAKQIVLAAAYEALYSHAEYDNYIADEIHELISDTFSLGYTRRILTALKEDGLISINRNDDESAFYSLTDAGLLAAEKLSAVDLIKARFSQNNPVLDVQVPAADRVVKLNHNQVAEAEEPIKELLTALESDNGDPEQPGLRERLIGQIKSGRELIRSGEYRAYLLYEVLVKALNEILSKYGNDTIRALANALLGAVVAKLIEPK